VGRFDSIKKSRKKSKDIDEKIEYLNKELCKTGLNEMMTTTKVYQGTDKVDNPIHTSFNNASFNGLGLGHSGSDGVGIGGAYVGKVIASEHGLTPGIHDNILNLDGVAVSPPHPISGNRRYASTRTGMVDFSPSQPGKRQGSNSRVTGSVIWLWNANANNLDGTTGNWYPLEFDTTQDRWAFWDSNFLGFGFLNGNLSQLEFSPGDNTGSSVVSLFNSIGINNKGVVGTPKTIVLTQNRLDDPSFIPIDIGKLSPQGYNYLKRKSRRGGGITYSSSSSIRPVTTTTSTQTQQTPPSSQTQQTPPLSSLPSAPSDAFEPETVSVDSTKDANPNVKDAKLGTWMSRQDFVQTYKGSSMEEYLNSLPYGSTNFMKPDPNFPGARIIDTDAYEKYFMNGDTSGLSDSKPKHTKTSVVPSRVAPVSASKPSGFLDKILSAGADVVGRGAAKDVFDYYMKNVDAGSNAGEHNVNNLLGRSARAIEKWYARNKTNIVTGREKGKSIFKDAAQYDFQYLSSTDGNLKNITGNLDFNRGDGVFDVGDEIRIVKHYDFNGERDLAGGGVVGNLGSKGYAKSKGIMKYLGDDGTATSPLMKLVITIDQTTGRVKTSKSVKESLDESVKLGHFEPEVLNVDIGQLRKGIIPEFPKDPPPEMINGYSEKSKLAPKMIKGEPFLNITRKDLAKNHRFTDKEISEYMDEINAINDYIRKNPAELKYAMIRYPKDDPRLAQLNFKMDQMKAASDEYMETHFPENKSLFNKLQQKISNTIDQTDPKNFKDHTPPPQFTDELKINEQRKKIISKHFNKPVKIKKLFRG